MRCAFCFGLHRHHVLTWYGRACIRDCAKYSPCQHLQDGIFKVVRCMHCRTQAKNIEGKASFCVHVACCSFDFSVPSVDAEVYEYQLAQLEALRVKYELPDVGKVVRVLLDYAVKDGDETAIFFTPDTCDCGAH